MFRRSAVFIGILTAMMAWVWIQHAQSGEGPALTASAQDG